MALQKIIVAIVRGDVENQCGADGTAPSKEGNISSPFTIHLYAKTMEQISI
tara:strand:- start:912 stop:1064 length:153 start_codon:yes stop_codon:yes gene_type:complete